MYYVVEITTYMDSTPKSKGVYDYSTRDEAEGTFHQKLGGAMKNTNYASELLMAFDEDGGVIAQKSYKREIIPTPEPTPETN